MMMCMPVSPLMLLIVKIMIEEKDRAFMQQYSKNAEKSKIIWRQK